MEGTNASEQMQQIRHENIGEQRSISCCYKRRFISNDSVDTALEWGIWKRGKSGTLEFINSDDEKIPEKEKARLSQFAEQYILYNGTRQHPWIGTDDKGWGLWWKKEENDLYLGTIYIKETDLSLLWECSCIKDYRKSSTKLMKDLYLSMWEHLSEVNNLNDTPGKIENSHISNASIFIKHMIDSFERLRLRTKRKDNNLLFEAVLKMLDYFDLETLPNSLTTYSERNDQVFQYEIGEFSDYDLRINNFTKLPKLKRHKINYSLYSK